MLVVEFGGTTMLGDRDLEAFVMFEGILRNKANFFCLQCLSGMDSVVCLSAPEDCFRLTKQGQPLFKEHLIVHT